MDFLGAALIAVGLFGGVLGYPVLQILALKRMQGKWRKLALLPLLVMVPVLFVTFQGLYKGSNLWPLFFIFTSPFAMAYLAVLLWRHSKRNPKI